MILIFGGKYQGQLEYALEKYGLKEETVFTCKDKEIDYSKKVIADLNEFVWQCTLKGVEAKDEINWEKMNDKIVICDDVSEGLVPMDKNEREYREMLGRTMMALGQKAEHVVRVFCGLAQELK